MRKKQSNHVKFSKQIPYNSMNFSCCNKRAFLNCNFSQLIVVIHPSKKSWVQICTQRIFWPKVKSFQGQGGLVKMPNGGPRHFDRRWATCLGSRELLPWWQSWAGQAAGKKGGPPSVKLAHGCGNGRYLQPFHEFFTRLFPDQRQKNTLCYLFFILWHQGIRAKKSEIFGPKIEF